MSIESYIVNDMEICQITEKIGDLKKKFNELTYSHMPVGKDGVYLGSISENDVRCFDAEKTLADYQYALQGFFARVSDNWLDTLETFAQNQANILPVLGSENQYLGYLELSDILHQFNETPFLNEPGGIVVLEKGSLDYSFSEIGQIIESQNARISGMFVSSQENDLTQITVKVNASGLNEILQTLRRYGYTIISEHQEDLYSKNLIERSRYLDKYLNI
ncbi:CBS domain-containing protein [Gillisia hiemivivida]|uniref:CBS domain-containing protein n=1 Tax=Gillisia hiemivivida TaxID=291190 RepID=A0A5C6ZV05_9FLAO|nr:CBS domain-containing protein [Gillisia hiemivivida]TXD94724.1 CBS domain-containing protein [Gillisia hiemivivida]